MTLTSREGEELSISLRQSSSFCRVACPRRPATRPSTVRTCPVMTSAYRGVMGALFGRLQMGCTGVWRLVFLVCGVRRSPLRWRHGRKQGIGVREGGFREGRPLRVGREVSGLQGGKRFYGELFGW